MMPYENNITFLACGNLIVNHNPHNQTSTFHVDSCKSMGTFDAQLLVVTTLLEYNIRV